MTSATVVSRDEDTGGQTVTSSITEFGGETRSVENTATKTDDGAKHVLMLSDVEDGDEAESEDASSPES